MGRQKERAKEQATRRAGRASAEAEPTKKPARKAKKKSTKKNKSTAKTNAKAADGRLALNTIKKSIKMATENGFKVTTHEKEMGNAYQLTIEIPKEQ